MGKRRIDVKEAVADIRSGMDDYDLMTKYQVASDGLMSLLDKLVAGGYIDISEIGARMPGFLGTLGIPGPALHGQEAEEKKQPAKDKPVIHVNAQEAARDIRSGMDDAELMKKFGLSSKGLQSIFSKLMARGLITQEILDHRGSEMEHTIDLRDEMLSLDHALRTLGTTVFPTDNRVARTRQEESDRLIERPGRKDSPVRKIDEQPVPESGPTAVVKPPWYDSILLTTVCLIVCFPLGFYALYRNSRLSVLLKVSMAAGWIILLTAALALIFNFLGWVRFPHF